MTRLPQPGSDDGTWGSILNDYLSQEHNADGTLKIRTNGTLDGKYSKPGSGIPATDLSTDVQTSLTKADSSIPVSQKGASNGVATLDSDGKVPTGQLPAIVSSGAQVVAYAGDVGAARPSGAPVVLWVNWPSQPTNWVDGDIWLEP
jgi:hypothetical protein